MSLAFTMQCIVSEESEKEDFIVWFIKANVQSRPLIHFHCTCEKVPAIALAPILPNCRLSFFFKGCGYVVLDVAVQLICIQEGSWSAWCYKMESRFFILVPAPLGQHKAPLKLVYWSPFPDWILNSQMLMALLWTLYLFKCQTQLSQALSRWAWPKEASKTLTLSHKISFPAEWDCREMDVTGCVWLCLLFKFQIERMHKVITLNEEHCPWIEPFN